MVLDGALLYTQHYKVKIKGKMEQSREKRLALSSVKSYWKESLRVTLDEGRQLYLLKCVFENNNVITCPMFKCSRVEK